MDMGSLKIPLGAAREGYAFFTIKNDVMIYLRWFQYHLEYLNINWLQMPSRTLDMFQLDGTK